MYVYIHVLVYIVHICLYSFICLTYTCMHIYVCIHTCTCIHPSRMHVFICLFDVHIDMCMYTPTYTYVHVYIHLCTYSCFHVHILRIFRHLYIHMCVYMIFRWLHHMSSGYESKSRFTPRECVQIYMYIINSIHLREYVYICKYIDTYTHPRIHIYVCISIIYMYIHSCAARTSAAPCEYVQMYTCVS